ncbi:MAG: OmpH family outer membrane protein [Bdellovibrionales bacterium]|nr:OmpH family outer membrane protein [Bdellovibrionales bacterium]
MKSTLVFALTALLLTGFDASASADVKIGIVDLPQAIQATKEGKKIKKQLEAEYNKKKSEMEKIVKDIGKMQTDFEKKSLVLSDEARMKKQQEIDGEKAKYMELREKNLQDLAKKDRELSQPMIKKLNEVIGEIAKKEGFTVILHKNDQNLVWASKEVDITDQVVKALEK